ncbi:hypothetical protein H5410_022871, partial [Solanum commersonii]
MSTISPVNIGETSPLNTQSPLDLHNEPGPCSSMLSDLLFEEDLPENKSSESNILAASMGEDYEEKREKQVKEPSKGKSQGKGKSKASVAKNPMGNEDDHRESKQSIVNNLRLQKVLGGRVFNLDIITKHGMNSLYDLVEIQSWTHLFMTKSPVLHEEEDGSINTRVGDTNLHLIEDLLGQILEVPREGTRSVIRKTCTAEFVKECSKIPNTRRVGIQKKLMKGEYKLLFEFVNK